MKIIDFHTHAFPDELAPRAMKILKKEVPGGLKAYHDGTISGLLASMDECDIDKSVVCGIATRPEQFESIFNWCKQIHSARLEMFPSVHPDDPQCLQQLGLIKQAGFKGIKLHPYYQDFQVDEDKLFSLYEKACAERLIVAMHTGFDVAFPEDRRAEPEKILRVVQTFPNLKLIATHLGAWGMWDESEKLLIGRQIYIEISFALDYLAPDSIKKLILAHPREYVLFGTDSPWDDQKRVLAMLREFNLGEQLERSILYENAVSVLKTTF